MADIYFDITSGNDTTGDGSEGNPYKSVSKCCSVANDGDTIRLIDGFHVGDGLKFISTCPANVTVTSENDDPSTCGIDGGDMWWYVTAANANITFTNLTFRNQVQTSQDCITLNSTGSSATFTNIIIKNLKHTGSGGFVGSTVNDHGDIVMRNTIVDDYTSDTGSTSKIIKSMSTAANHSVTVENNTFYFNDGKPGSQGLIRVEGSSATKNIYFRNNIVYHNNAAAFTVVSIVGTYDTLYFKNNCIYEAPSGGTITDYSGGTGTVDSSGNLYVDPQLVDVENALFQLRSGSPCIDGGIL